MYETALVVGLGVSGEAASRLLLAEGTRVLAIDAKDAPCLRERAGELERAGAMVLLGRREAPDGEFSVCIVSPGVPADSDVVRTIERRGIPVVSELELGWDRCGVKTVAITGSNGKSTQAKLCRDALVNAGMKTELTGNYGVPISSVALASDRPDWIVVEASSFQLEKVVAFRPDVGVLLNIFPNHLDRHGDMRTYAEVKRRLFDGMTERDVGVVPESMATDISASVAGCGGWVTFGSSDKADVRYCPGHVVCKGGDTVSIAGTIFDNEILGPSVAASVAAIRACGFSVEHVADAARSFRCLPHRMEQVAEVRGVRFIDDSKATNLAAMSAALQVFERPVRLIAGGRLKEKNLRAVKELLGETVRCVYLIGEAMDAMAVAWAGMVACRKCARLDEAVSRAWEDAREGEVILLSPGCASFDQFTDFEQRGEQFKSIVESLAASTGE